MQQILIAILLIGVGTEIANGLPSGISKISNDEDPLNNNLEITSQERNLKLLKKHAHKIREYQARIIEDQPDQDKRYFIDLTCTACNFAVGVLQFYATLGLSDSVIMSHMKSVCSTFNIESDEVCNGIIKLFGPEVVYLLRHVSISPSQACGFILENSCSDTYSPYHQWDVDIPPSNNDKPIVKPKPINNPPLLKVLHLSDTHYDPDYTAGMNGNCPHPLCCRAENGRPANPKDGAGKWGHYGKCDTPKRTIDNLFDHIVKVHSDIDYIIWTGDIPPHNVWTQNKTYNLNIIKETAKEISEKFPNTPIFPALGNHESAPVDTFPPHYLDHDHFSSSWLYDELDAIWKNWLPANVSQTVRYGAFYSIRVKPGFRVISLNMNYCNNKNFWLLVNSTDPDRELQWLIDELENAEKLNEKVHIIGHIPPGSDDCLKVWSRNFYKIVARYENTIMAQFYGHTHYDELELFYDPDDLERPTGIAYIGPSVTPFIGLNPGYRIYYVDGDHNKTTRMVVDHETWIMNLKQANIDDNPQWYKLYTAKLAYGMQNLRPEDWNDIVKAMEKNDVLFQTYYRYYWKDSPVRLACDSICKNSLICDMKSGRSHDRKQLCGKRRKFQRKEQKENPRTHTNSWSNVLQVGLKSVNNFMNYFQQQAQVMTNDIDPLGVYEEL